MHVNPPNRGPLPQRVVGAEQARADYGEYFDRLMPWLRVADPVADAAVLALSRMDNGWAIWGRALKGAEAGVPDEVLALLEQARHVPLWVDWDRIDAAGRMFFRTGVIGGMVLGARSLIAGYASPIGNKPLVLTGQLQRDTSHRLAETGKFVAAVSTPGGLRPGAEGWSIALRVRLMHAEVRRLIDEAGTWDDVAWGRPISQHDMLATSLLFSEVWLDGVREMGLVITEEEGRDWLHLWRWASVVLGVDPELLPVEEAHAATLASLIRDTQGRPDDDGRALTAALLDGGPRPEIGHALCHHLLGSEMATDLGIPDTSLRHAVRVVAKVARPVDAITRTNPLLQRLRLSWGQAYWKAALRVGAGGRPMAFRTVDALRGVPPKRASA